MTKRLLSSFSALVLSCFFATAAFSHAGSHENKNCFLTLNHKTLRFSGYQFQGLHPDEAFCHVLPYLGSVIIHIEPVSASLSNYAVQLSFADVLSRENASLFKQTPLQSFGQGVVMLQTDVQTRGLYALDLNLFEKGKAIAHERFYVLVGIPVTKILVIFSGILLIFLIIYQGVRRFITAKPQ
jgi:hypothetical protein